MNQQYPQQPNQPQQPGWGAPQQQPYGAPPQWQPPQPKKNSFGKVVGIGCGGLLALFVVIGIAGAIGGSGSDDKSGSGSTAVAEQPKSDEPTKADKKPAEKHDSKPKEPAGPVKVTAKKTAFTKTMLADGSAYTSVLVTIKNSGDDSISVNPLYFTITDTNGTKHGAELAADEKQIDTVDLAPGENISGTITGKGKFTPKYVTYTDGLLGDPLRVNVS
ncbi:DUF4352 domain-containing protein [Streptomyces sp. NPDC058755]|uniref:DUF4352 domain-containing protein n=1 Tax=Streptomyces sp. NPDC058755 TaxID=3346624 RepID=UPI0036BE034E